RQTRHRYVLISPGPRREVRQVAESVWTARVYGLRASRDPERYRMLSDYAGVRAAIERFSPDVLETHDPWFSLPMGLMLRHRGPYRGLLTTYCHSDPIRTYVHPRVSRYRRLSKIVDRFERRADRELHRLHGACHTVFVASDIMHQRLKSVGVDNILQA